MLQTLVDWQTVIRKIKQDYPEVSPHSSKFKTLAARLIDAHQLSTHDVTQIALHLGFKWYPRPKNLPTSWRVILCQSYLAQRYINDQDPREYVVVKPPDMMGGLPFIIHRTPIGFADNRWFLDVIPNLESILKGIFSDGTIRYPLTEGFNSAINDRFKNERNGQGMTLGQVHAFNLFFDMHVPAIEMCTTCFKVSLPNSWGGERWTHRTNEKFEVRLSAAKHHARFPWQQVDYVTHREIDQNHEEIYAIWDVKNKTANFDKERKQQNTHIPWDVYDFNKFNIRMPVCKCLKRVS